MFNVSITSPFGLQPATNHQIELIHYRHLLASYLSSYNTDQFTDLIKSSREFFANCRQQVNCMGLQLRVAVQSDRTL